MYNKYKKSEILFTVDGVDHSFTVYHNLEAFGLSILAAFTNWVYRAEEFTEKDFCAYVGSKDCNILCFTSAEMEEIMLELADNGTE
jgi:hypothetical protein